MARDVLRRTSSLSRWTFVALGVTLACYMANAFLGALNQDEGWYLYAARCVMGGELPHRDFFFTQGKIMPIVYACFGWLWSAFGVLGGRLFTSFLSFLALMIADSALVSCCTKSEERKLVRLILWSLLGVNLWYTYFTCIPKAYGLCTLGIAIGLRLLTGLREKNGVDTVCCLLSGVVFALLADVRFSMGGLVPAIAGWLWTQRSWMGRWAWGYFSFAACGTWCVLFLPEVLFHQDAFWEAVRFHAQRESLGMFGRIGCIARLGRFNPLLTFAGCLMGWMLIAKKPSLRMTTESRSGFLQLWLLCAIVLGSVHILAPVPYDDYFIPALLPFAMAIAFGFSRLPFDSMRAALAKTVFLSAATLTICASPVAQDWIVSGKDRLWVQIKTKPDLFVLWDVAKRVRLEAVRLQEETLWTQDTYLAVEAGLKVPKGLEMGPFSKPMPLDTAPRLAAWSGYTFAFHYPQLSPAADQRMRIEQLQKVYSHSLLHVPAFGQGGTPLTVAERVTQ